MKGLENICERFDDEKLDSRSCTWTKEFLRHLWVERGLSQNTLRAYAVDLRAYLDWARRAACDPAEPGYRRFRRFLADMERGGLSKKTMARRLAAVRTWFSYLNQRGYVDQNPAAASVTPKIGRGLPRRIPGGDADKLIATCERSSEPVDMRDAAFLQLLYATGARISEVAGLEVLDVDLCQGVVRLFGKGSKERIVPVYQEALDAVSAYCEQARPSLLQPGRPSTQALFISARGNAMSADSLRRVFKQRTAQAGLDPSMHPHDLRHSFATELLEGGADMRSVQEMLGHASLSTTQVYTHLSVKHMQDTLKQAHPRS